MKKIRLLALAAASSPWRYRRSHREFIWTWAVMGLVATAMMAGATGTTTARVTGMGIGTAIVEDAATAGILSPQHCAI